MLTMKVGGKFFHSYAVWYAQGELFTNKSVYQSKASQPCYDYSICPRTYEPSLEKQQPGFPSRSDTNPPAQSKKQAGSIRRRGTALSE